eukprot:4966884-Karenia_brevis.AAC.1
MRLNSDTDTIYHNRSFLAHGIRASLLEQAGTMTSFHTAVALSHIGSCSALEQLLDGHEFVY